MTGLVKTLRDLEYLKADLNPNNSGRAKTLLQKLAIDCRVDAEEMYKAEAENIEGAAEITVTDSVDGDTATITAEGDKIMFVEFGTGINLNDGSVSRAAGEYGFHPASFSMQNKQWLLPPRSIMFKGWWPIPGTYGQGTRTIQTKNGPKEVPSNIWTEGHPPVDAMYHTFEHLKNSYFPEEAKRIF